MINQKKIKSIIILTFFTFGYLVAPMAISQTSINSPEKPTNKTIQCLCITTGDYECDGYGVLQFNLSPSGESLTAISLGDKGSTKKTKTIKAMKSNSSLMIENNRVKYTLLGEMKEESYPFLIINQSVQQLTTASPQSKKVQVELPEYIDGDLTTTWTFNKCKVVTP